MHTVTKKILHQVDGFTLADLMVSAGILVIIFSVVIANFRGVQKNNISFAVQQLSNDLVETQTIGTSGRLFSPADQTYPAGGYGIKLTADPGVSDTTYTLFGDSAPIDGTGPTIENGSRDILAGNRVVGLYSSVLSTPPPPFAAGWDPIVNREARLLFNQDGVVVYFAGDVTPRSGITYIGIALENTNNNRQGFIYVSVKTGLINSGIMQ